MLSVHCAAVRLCCNFSLVQPRYVLLIIIWSCAVKEVQARRFYQALHTVEELQRTHSKSLAELRLDQRIPELRESIRKAMKTEITDWLSEYVTLRCASMLVVNGG